MAKLIHKTIVFHYDKENIVQLMWTSGHYSVNGNKKAGPCVKTEAASSWYLNNGMIQGAMSI